MKQLRLSEMSDGNRYRTDWYCDPPTPSQGFMVREEDWIIDGDLAVREIYRIDLAEPVLSRVYGDLIVQVLP